MGAEQSSPRGAGAASAEATPTKTCYYELLCVERTASDDEIRKAYRRRALELHPDRNLDDTATATRRFAEVQAAYEVLADPQERAWYDAHRDAILRGDSGGGGGGDDDGGGDDGRYYNSVRLTPADALYALMGAFGKSVPMTDAPTGFFGRLEATFAQLALEEEAAAAWDGGAVPTYAPFGSAADDYEAVVRPFYRDWGGFATVKSFSWRDRHRLADAPDRAVRRLMERENRRARDAAAREFNDAVRALVAFVRKRDPRYAPNAQSDADRQRALRDAAAAQAARQRAANQARRAAAHEDADRLAPDAPDGPDAPDDPHAGGFSSDEASVVHEEIECVVCDKTFKSEKQFDAHERSKKHIKAVQQLRRDMRRENRDLRLDDDPDDAPVAAPAKSKSKKRKGKKPRVETDEDEDENNENDENDENGKDGKDGKHDRSNKDAPASAAPEPEAAPRHDDGDASSSEENDEYAPRDVVEKRFDAPTAGAADDDDTPNSDGSDGLGATLDSLCLDNDEDDDDNSENGRPAAKAKVGKAKAKREKKAARQAAAMQDDATTTCRLCNEAFSSNTKLHRHLRTAHPAPAAVPKAKGGGKKKKG